MVARGSGGGGGSGGRGRMFGMARLSAGRENDRGAHIVGVESGRRVPKGPINDPTLVTSPTQPPRPSPRTPSPSLLDESREVGEPI